MAISKRKLLVLVPVILLAAGALIVGYFSFSGAVDSRGCQNALYRYVERSRLEQAADNGDLRAAEMLTRIYEKGQTRDPVKAAHYADINHTAAIKAGDPEAEYGMALKYLVMDMPPGSVNIVCPTSPENLKAHIDWLTKAADHGHRPAQTQLGQLYAEGRCGLPREPSRGYQWYVISGEGEASLSRIAGEANLSADEIARVKQAAADWKPKPYSKIKPKYDGTDLYKGGRVENYNRSANRCCTDNCLISDFFE